MPELVSHWTERSLDDFLYRLASDFVRQLQEEMERADLSQDVLAEKLGVSKGRVSQVLNNPGNLTLRKIVEYARAVDRKVSVVTYDDSDPDNLNGPVDAEIFKSCWENAGKPTDFFALQEGGEGVVSYKSFLSQERPEHVATTEGWSVHGPPPVSNVANTSWIVGAVTDTEMTPAAQV